MSVCDYTNQPGFSLQERLLRDAYREIRELEEEIKKHPSRGGRDSVDVYGRSGWRQHFCKIEKEDRTAAELHVSG